MLNLLKSQAATLELPVEVLAALSGVPASTLSMAMRGTKDLPRERFLAVDALLRELRELVEFHAPVPISWKNPAIIRDLLDEMRRAKRHPAPPDPWTLLTELNAADADTVATKHGWTRHQLIEQLTAAREQLHEATVALSARNDYRAAVLKTSS
jgi:hypothetical protein